MEKKAPKRKGRYTRILIPLEQIRWSLAKLWFGVSIPILIILIGQSIFGKYEGKVQAVWSWALPTLMPTISLIITVLGANAIRSTNDDQKVRRSFYLIAFWLSAFYLFLILATLLVEPFTQFEPLELLNTSNLWLGPLQGIVASALAVLFFSRQNKDG